MKSRFRSVTLTLSLLGLGGFWTCRRGACPDISIPRDVKYIGQIPSNDGGTPTQVELIVSSTGMSQIKFRHDGIEILETFEDAR